MKPHFLFPPSLLDPRGREIDEPFQAQASALKMAGFGVSTISIGETGIRGEVPPGSTAVYRGWMMDEIEYRGYLDVLHSHGITPLTSLNHYLAAHWLPRWYSLVDDLTPHTVIFPNSMLEVGRMLEGPLYNFAILENYVRSVRSMRDECGWFKFQLKDYVKSLKTAGGSTVEVPEDVAPVIANMIKYRGTIEGGICVRHWENFIPGSETRFFVLNGGFYSPSGPSWSKSTVDKMLSCDPTTGVNVSGPLGILLRVARLPIPFFSVDIARRLDGEYRLVEIGDGQVSDLVGWSPERFADIWTYANAN
jgi:hypothetical protein